MPLRGSVQLLLLSLRRRATRKAGIGAVAAILVLIGGVQLKDALPTLGEDGLTQALRQSVWKQALGDRSKPVQWPWEDLSVSMSLAPSASVPRLGLSAAMQQETPGFATRASAPPDRTARVKPRTVRGGPVEGDIALGDVTGGGVIIGDSITFTAADGATCVYRVTGRRVVDPHLAASEAERFDGEAAMFECGPLESLIMQATQGEPEAAPDPAQEQQRKL
jgi:hypothetical protein